MIALRQPLSIPPIVFLRVVIACVRLGDLGYQAVCLVCVTGRVRTVGETFASVAVVSSVLKGLALLSAKHLKNSVTALQERSYDL